MRGGWDKTGVLGKKKESVVDLVLPVTPQQMVFELARFFPFSSSF